jgi:hypothetical protein
MLLADGGLILFGQFACEAVRALEDVELVKLLVVRADDGPSRS